MAEEQGRGPPSHYREDATVNFAQSGDARQRAQFQGAPPPDRRYPDDEQHQRRAMAAPVTLPAIQDPYGQQQQYSRSYPPPDHRGDNRADPRASGYNASPSSVNGYNAPMAQGSHPTQLPPLQPPGPRSPTYPGPPDARDDYYRNRQPPAQHYPDPYHPDYRQPPPPPPPHPGRYPEYAQPGPQGAPRYDYGPPPPPGVPRWDYAQNPASMPQAAPRQRTSIACKYCRKRKIRCSGYQSAPGGKCINCSRMNQECIFQPVSSSSSAAFIPVSALPGGVPPGTTLYGAYGQPLHHGSVPPPGQGQQPYPPPPPPPHAHPQGGNGFYSQSMPSPTNAYSPYDPRAGGRRRPRDPDEGDELRPPPPDPVASDDPRRRSPASSSNHSSPSGVMSYPSSQSGTFDSRAPPHHRHSPGQSSLGPLATTPGDERTPSGNQRHSNSSTPAGQSSSSVMSLNNLVDNASGDIDKSMLGRLNRGPGSGSRR